MGHNIIKAIIMTGIAKGENVIPRVPISPTGLHFHSSSKACIFRVLFHVNKQIQGQTLEAPGVHLENNSTLSANVYRTCKFLTFWLRTIKKSKVL